MILGWTAHTMVDMDIRTRALEVARATYAQIEARGWDPTRQLYGEYDKLSAPAYNWGVGVLISALNAYGHLQPDAWKRRAAYWPAVKRYFNSRPPVPGFDVAPDPGGIDRYYDDNAWMAIALLEAGEGEFREFALKALDYSLSGWDENSEAASIGGNRIARPRTRAQTRRWPTRRSSPLKKPVAKTTPIGDIASLIGR